VWAQYSNLYLLAMCRANVNAAAVLAFLHSVLDVFKHYFSELEEESLRDNFVIAYELLDEVRGGRQRPAPSRIHIHVRSNAMQCTLVTVEFLAEQRKLQAKCKDRILGVQ
jgi:Clathrin adaptor complex small chain